MVVAHREIHMAGFPRCLIKLTTCKDYLIDQAPPAFGPIVRQRNSLRCLNAGHLNGKVGLASVRWVPLLCVPFAHHRAVWRAAQAHQRSPAVKPRNLTQQQRMCLCRHRYWTNAMISRINTASINLGFLPLVSMLHPSSCRLGSGTCDFWTSY